MKSMPRIFLFGTYIVILVAAACAPVGEGAAALPGALQDALTGSATAATNTTETAATSQATATNTTLTPSIPVTGLDIIRLNCQYCVDNIAHAQLVIPREAKFEVISPPELVSPPGDDDDDKGEDNGEGRRLTTELVGAVEVPPGDPDGSGTATIRLRPEKGEACFELTASDIGPATAAHIHEGAEGVAGPAVVTLDPPTGGSSSGCVSNVDTDLLRNILQNPEQYYVNVHNEEFPDGAIRGQLGRGNKNDNGNDDNGNGNNNNNGDDDDGEDDDNGNGGRLGCRVIDRFRDTKLVLCRAEENTIITLNVCLDDTCTEVQLTLQSCAPTATPTPVATTTSTATATSTLATISATAVTTTTSTATSTPIAPATGTSTSTPTAVTNTPTATASPTSTVTPISTSTSTSTPTP